MLEPCANCSDRIHWIYSAEHLSFVPGTCGHGFNVSHPVLHTDSSPFKAFSTRVRTFFSFPYKLQYRVEYRVVCGTDVVLSKAF